MNDGFVMSITLRQLQMFMAVAETDQVKKASKKLSVTQSAVSIGLAEFENKLGGTVFDRQGRGLLLNSRGYNLYPLVKDITCQVANVEAAMIERNAKLSGQIDIIASLSLGNYILPYLIGAFIKIHPNVAINMQVYNTLHATKMVIDSAMDVGFVDRSPIHKAIVTRPWFQDELVVLIGRANPLFNNAVFDPETDFENSKWVMREKDSGTASFFEVKMKRYQDKMDIIRRMGHPEAVKRAVESGVETTCLSNLTVFREIEHGLIRSLKVKGIDMRRQHWVISRKDKAMSEALVTFLDFCDIMSCWNDKDICLSSPRKMQSFLARRSKKKVVEDGHRLY